MRVLDAIGHALAVAGSMTWQITWSLILGFTLSAVVELVARSAIRPGSKNYARLRGTRGAATLLQSNVSIYGETVKLRFKAKGGKLIEKEIHAPKLASAGEVTSATRSFPTGRWRSSALRSRNLGRSGRDPRCTRTTGII